MAYRAFFALPDSMATADGRPTNAIFGLASMLVKLISDYRPRQIAVAWDAGMSGREVVYPEYKSHRPPKPDLLRQQWPHLLEMVEAFGYTNVKVDGYEADDVIATLTRQATEVNIPVVVVTGDRDAYQLVTDTVQVMSTSRGVTETKLYDREGVKERYGVYPELVTDLMGLRGDTSDNIPGVPGIGEKTAAQLLDQFGSLEEILANVDQVSGKKRKENLTEFAEDARISKQLATMDFEVETGVDIDELMATAPDREGLRAFMTEFELRAAMKRLEEALGDGAVPGVSEEAPAPAEVEVSDGGVDDLADGPIAVELYNGWAATDGRKVVGGQADPDGLAQMVQGKPLIGHDIKAIGGQRVGLLASLEATEKGPVIAHDTLVAAYLLEPARRNYHLDELAVQAGLAPSGIDDEDGQMSLIADDSETGSIAPEIAATVWNLAQVQKPKLEEAGLVDLLEQIEQPLIRVLAAMERIGLKLDTERVAEMASGLEDRILELEKEIHGLAGHEFTIGSPQQVGQVLFEELGLTRKRKGKTGFSTDARVLAQIREEHAIVALIEEWRELTKLKNTYLEPLPAAIDPGTGRVHTTFMQTAAPTGRISSIQPNLQSIPIRSDVGRPLRGCFVAEPGNLLTSLDYSQVELRVLAHVADEEVLKGFFRAGEDVHTATAAQVFEIEVSEVGESERSKAKMVNFGIVYGLTGFGLADRLNIPRSEGEEFVKRYHERFPAVTAFRERVVEEATETGFVKTLLGRRRPLPELRSSQAQIRAQGVRLAMNTVVQGTAADIIKRAMAAIDQWLGKREDDAHMLMQVHDELVFEVRADAVDDVTKGVRIRMQGAAELTVPLLVEVGAGANWNEAH